ncbi:MAG: hypothetical protein KAS72_14365 [Phycisphaerales bacterium]|nr:hypothetical protein [Phycisphaerales bacterium]
MTGRLFPYRFSAAGLPLMSRPSYRRELTVAALMPVALSMLEGGILGVIAKKAFDAPDLAIAFITAGPAMANMTSFLWTHAIRGRNRVRAVNLAQIGVLVMLLVIATAPAGNSVGLWMLLIASTFGRICMTGIITARADIWRANYPRATRFHVIGNFTILTAAIIALSGIMVGQAMDMNEHSYHLFLPISAAIGLVGAIIFSRLRWRGGRSFSRRERHADAAGGNGASAAMMLRVLREDPHYRLYMICQFVLGIANLSLMPPLIKALDETFHLQYRSSITLTTTIPIGLMVFALPFWSWFLSRVHIVHFRAIQSWFFVIAIALTAVSILGELLLLLYISRIILGIARGGGALAWNLGHNDFSSREMAPIYMGIHVTLTGVRGALGPFFGMLLYAGFTVPMFGLHDTLQPTVEHLQHLGFAITPDGALRVPGVGGWTFVLLTILAFLASLGFVWQSITLRARSRGAHAELDA